MTHYYGLSLGPITATIGRVRKTRELWGASYTFSLLMKRILKDLEDKKFNILLPCTEFDMIPANLGAGLFPDVMMLTGQESDGETICRSIQSSVDSLSADIAKDLGESEEAVQQYFRRYIQTNLVSFSPTDLPDVMKSATGSEESNKELSEVSQAIIGLNHLLSSAELRTQFQPESGKDFLFDYLEKRAHLIADNDPSVLMRDAFPDIKEDENRILSIPEIACKGLEAYKSDFRKEVLDKWFRISARMERQGEDEDSLYQHLQDNFPELANKLQTYHRYIAIVYADGDNIGKTIEAISSKKEVDAFSKKLLRFGIDAGGMIELYGGKLVYAGGDDLLFFAPVKAGNSTIFHLCERLDGLFRDSFGDHDSGEEENPPSLSFGLSISYHKFPLYEALGTGWELLTQKAKKFPNEDNRTKNALAFQLLKHSGQHFGQTLAMKSATYQSFRDIMQAELTSEGRFLSSVMFMIEEQKAVFDSIGQMEDPSDRLIRIQQVFANNFDEAPHEGEAKLYLESVRKLVNNAYTDYPWTAEHQGNDARKAVYSILRTIHFLKQAYDE